MGQAKRRRPCWGCDDRPAVIEGLCAPCFGTGLIPSALACAAHPKRLRGRDPQGTGLCVSCRAGLLALERNRWGVPKHGTARLEALLLVRASWIEGRPWLADLRRRYLAGERQRHRPPRPQLPPRRRCPLHRERHARPGSSLCKTCEASLNTYRVPGRRPPGPGTGARAALLVAPLPWLEARPPLGAWRASLDQCTDVHQTTRRSA